jgi:hypothetical protein
MCGLSHFLLQHSDECTGQARSGTLNGGVTGCVETGSQIPEQQLGHHWRKRYKHS